MNVLAAPPAPLVELSSSRRFTPGTVVRQKLGPTIAGSIVRFSGIPGMWFVHWTDGTCRLCSGAFLEAIPETALERMIIRED